MEEFICCYCNKVCKNKNSKAKHECRCKNNPAAKPIIPWNKGLTKEIDDRIANIGHIAWNKGLTAKTDQRIAAIADLQRGKPKNSPGVASTPEKELLRKQRISKAMQGNHNNNPNKTGRGKKGKYKGIYCDSTYELALVIYCLDHNIDIKRYDGYYEYYYENKIHRYYPDFIIDGVLYEIKGFWTELVDIKAASVTDKQLKILYKQDLLEVFNYIKSKYNKDVDINISDLYDKE